MTAQEKKERASMIGDTIQTKLDLDELSVAPVIFGYARVSRQMQARDGNSLEAQERALRAAGAVEIVVDAYTGIVATRPELDKLMNRMKDGDTICVTKLDRIARNLKQGIELIDQLNKRGIKVHVINMGIIDNTPTGQQIRNIMLALAEWERDMILQRAQDGKAIAKTKPGFREGRPRKFKRDQLDHAMNLLAEYSYSQVASMTGISTATLAREKARRKEL